jgi:DNA-directed RNA polymerase specialized sigma24 family protein
VSLQSSRCVLRAWNTYPAELLGGLRRQLHDAPDARDVLQDTFARAQREGRTFNHLLQHAEAGASAFPGTAADRRPRDHPLDPASPINP